jgi:hypothetical protein
MVAYIGSSRRWRTLMFRVLRREVVEKYLVLQDLPPSLLYAKAGSQDCPPTKVQIESVLNKP